MRPQRPTERLTVVVTVSRSPGERVDVAQRGPVGDAPQDDRGPEEGEEPVGRGTPAGPGLGEVLEAGEHEEPLPGALADHPGEVGDRGNVGHLVEREERGRARAPVASTRIGSVADVADRRHHERCELLLPAPRGADVQGVRTAAERLEVERRRERRRQGLTRAVRTQYSRCGGPDARLLPGVGGHDPGEHVGRRRTLSGPRRENFEGRGPVVTFDPMKDLRHGKAFGRRGMEQGREERAGTLGPVVFPRSRRAHATGGHHRIGGHDGGVPTGGGRQRRPPHTLDAVRTFHLAARVVEERPPVAAARRRRGAHHIRLRRRRDDGAVREQNIGYDQGGCLARPRRAKHQCRALRARPHPPVCSPSNIDAVARKTVDLSQCSSRNQARIVPVDMSMSALFHTPRCLRWRTDKSMGHFVQCGDNTTAITLRERSMDINYPSATTSIKGRRRTQNDHANKECLT